MINFSIWAHTWGAVQAINEYSKPMQLGPILHSVFIYYRKANNNIQTAIRMENSYP